MKFQRYINGKKVIVEATDIDQANKKFQKLLDKKDTILNIIQKSNGTRSKKKKDTRNRNRD